MVRFPSPAPFGASSLRSRCPTIVFHFIGPWPGRFSWIDRACSTCFRNSLVLRSSRASYQPAPRSLLGLGSICFGITSLPSESFGHHLDTRFREGRAPNALPPRDRHPTGAASCHPPRGNAGWAWAAPWVLSGPKQCVPGSMPSAGASLEFLTATTPLKPTANVEESPFLPGWQDLDDAWLGGEGR